MFSCTILFKIIEEISHVMKKISDVRCYKRQIKQTEVNTIFANVAIAVYGVKPHLLCTPDIYWIAPLQSGRNVIFLTNRRGLITICQILTARLESTKNILQARHI